MLLSLLVQGACIDYVTTKAASSLNKKRAQWLNVPLPVFGPPYLCGLVLRAGSYHGVLRAPTCTPYLCPGRGGESETSREREGREDKEKGERGSEERKIRGRERKG